MPAGHQTLAAACRAIKRFGAGQFFYIYGLGGHRPSGESQALPLTFPGLGKWDGEDGRMQGVFK